MKRILAIARFLLKAINSFNVKYNKTGFFFSFLKLIVQIVQCDLTLQFIGKLLLHTNYSKLLCFSGSLTTPYFLTNIYIKHFGRKKVQTTQITSYFVVNIHFISYLN